jgi:hypothetical protein
MSEFVEIKGFSKYLINKEGKIFSKHHNREVSIQTDIDGYLRVSMYGDDGKRMKKGVHRLLALQYIENPNNLPLIDHIDRNRQNNSLDNLRWCDYKENRTNSFRKSYGCITSTLRGDKLYYQAKIIIDKKKVLKSSYDRKLLEEWLKKKSNDIV